MKIVQKILLDLPMLTDQELVEIREYIQALEACRKELSTQ